MCAIYLLDILCRSAKSNRSLARAVQAGLLDLLRAIPADWKIKEHNVSDFIQLVCSGMHHARVIRAVVQRHPRSIDFAPLKGAAIDGQAATWEDAARLSNIARELYDDFVVKKGWRRTMVCHTGMVGRSVTA